MRALLSSALSMLLATVALGAAAPEDLRVSDTQMLRFARAHPAPVCPIPHDRPNSIGVVVAEIEVTADGTLASAAIHEAPTEAIARCVQRTLREWRFRAPGGKASTHYWTKLIFYAVADERGAISVRPATEVGFVELPTIRSGGQQERVAKRPASEARIEAE